MGRNGARPARGTPTCQARRLSVLLLPGPCLRAGARLSARACRPALSHPSARLTPVRQSWPQPLSTTPATPPAASLAAGRSSLPFRDPPPPAGTARTARASTGASPGRASNRDSGLPSEKRQSPPRPDRPTGGGRARLHRAQGAPPRRLPRHPCKAGGCVPAWTYRRRERPPPSRGVPAGRGCRGAGGNLAACPPLGLLSVRVAPACQRVTGVLSPIATARRGRRVAPEPCPCEHPRHLRRQVRPQRHGEPPRRARGRRGRRQRHPRRAPTPAPPATAAPLPPTKDGSCSTVS